MKQIYHNKLKGLPQNRGSLFLLMPINRFFGAGAVTARAFTRAAARGRAGLTVGAADAFFTGLFRLIDIKGCTTDNNNDYCNYKIINRSHYFIAPTVFSDFTALSLRIQSQVSTAAKQRTKISPPAKPAPTYPVTIRVPT